MSCDPKEDGFVFSAGEFESFLALRDRGGLASARRLGSRLMTPIFVVFARKIGEPKRLLK
jgi:hypothetical protein